MLINSVHAFCQLRFSRLSLCHILFLASLYLHSKAMEDMFVKCSKCSWENILTCTYLFSHLVSCVCVLGLQNWTMSVSVLKLVLISYRLHIGVVLWWISVVTLVPLFDYACLYLHSYNSSLPNVIPICVDHTYFILDAFLKKDWKGRCCRHCSQFEWRIHVESRHFF